MIYLSSPHRLKLDLVFFIITNYIFGQVLDRAVEMEFFCVKVHMYVEFKLLSKRQFIWLAIMYEKAFCLHILTTYGFINHINFVNFI